MSDTNIFAVVLAGGSGNRMGNIERPKQFLEIGGKPIIIHSIEKFVVHDEFEAVIVLTPKPWTSHTRDLIEKYIPGPMQGKLAVTEGGVTRNETVMNAIKYIEGNYGLDEETVIVTHDSVRPFVSNRMIEENIRYAKLYGACDTVVPATDTIVESADGTVIDSIPERKTLYQGQTPQSFNAVKLRNIYNALTEEEKQTLTDACKIMTMKGEKVYMVQGDTANIKITYPVDLKLAEALIGGI
ncbi:MAG: 2-C-methyl-D-erythritol 4-phosphate cytidylyltransferase [Lachnospiraceae bacterium]|nr:2-C-methyl-D-erythritol 4-phosphate cytidylyltransferase [Lachnospiraceae bacterium]